MGVPKKRKRRRRLQEEEETAEHLEDNSMDRLPDDVLCNIISLLPTKDGSRTQVLSTRWRPMWRSVPVNLDLQDIGRGAGRCERKRDAISNISHILSSAHPGPCRRFTDPEDYLRCCCGCATATLDTWLRSPVLDNLQELVFRLRRDVCLLPPLPASVHRFSSTLVVASFGGLHFPDLPGNASSAVRLPLLKQLSLFGVIISETSLHAWLAGCPVLESLLLRYNSGFSRLQIVSPSLRSIGVVPEFGRDQIRLKLVIEDAPCLERLLFVGCYGAMDISVIFAPRLTTLGTFSSNLPCLRIGNTVLQGSTVVSMTEVVCSVKVLNISETKLCFDVVINLLKCFPYLEELYMDIKRMNTAKKKAGYEYQQVIEILDIRLRKVVLQSYQGSSPHINLVKFFVPSAGLLRLHLEVANVTKPWIERQHRLLQIEKMALRGLPRIDFVCHDSWLTSVDPVCDKRVHDLSTNPFHRLH